MEPGHTTGATGRRSRRLRAKLTAAILGCLGIADAAAHGTGVTGTHVFDWHSERIARIVSPGFSWNNLGRTVIALPGETVSEANRTCLRAAALNIDVRDSYARDVHEPVELTLVVDRQTSAPMLAIHYDRVGGPGHIDVSLTAGNERFVRIEQRLDDARLANRGDHSTDIILTAPPAEPGQLPGVITVCDFDLERTFTTPTATPGLIELAFADERGEPTAVRVGLYDANEGLPTPSADAIAVRKFDDVTRTYLMQSTAVWPVDNRTVFYAQGRYRSEVPAGSYRLIVSKGPEYRLVDEILDVVAGKTTRRAVRLKRFADMPARGWLSGDVHIHNLRREQADNPSLLGQTSAEDVHVANILKMGNVGRAYFPQYAWGHDGRFGTDAHVLVPGQEDPRTLTLGHTIHLNLQRPVRFPDDYLSYHRVFEAAASQRGVSGFAHAAGGLPGTTEGMTMQAAFDLLDFAEVMQSSEIGTSVWYDLLNLGYRIAPAAGTDYPYIDHPGAVRTYVRVGASDGNAFDRWFQGLERGNTFVTNGPLLELTMNDVAVGETLRLSRGELIDVQARAELNPDIGTLAGLDLVYQGEVIDRVTAADGSRIRLQSAIPAVASGWYLIHATGTRSGHDAPIEAISAPVYVIVDDDARTWKREAVREITSRLIGMLDRVKTKTLDTVIESEAWHSMPVWQRDFVRQLERARPRIEATQARLQALAEQAR